MSNTKIKLPSSLFLAAMLFLFALPIFAQENQKAEKIFSIEMDKSGSAYSAKSIDVIFKNFTYNNDNYDEFRGKSYSGTAVSFKGLNLGYFFVPDVFPVICTTSIVESNGEKINTGGCKTLDNGSLTLEAPYFNNAKLIDVYSPKGEKIFTVDVSSKAVCNENGKCDKPVERYTNCQVDCPVYESLKEVAPTQIEEIKPNKEINFSWKILGIILGGLVLIGIVILAIIKMRKKNQI